MADYLFKIFTSLRNCNVACSPTLWLGGASEQLSGLCFHEVHSPLFMHGSEKDWFQICCKTLWTETQRQFRNFRFRCSFRSLVEFEGPLLIHISSQHIFISRWTRFQTPEGTSAPLSTRSRSEKCENSSSRYRWRGNKHRHYEPQPEEG